jgi:hypothetical protein
VRDDGSGAFDGGDALIASLTGLDLSSGVLIWTLPDEHTELRATPGLPATFFVAVDWTADAADQEPQQLTVTHRMATWTAVEDAGTDLELSLDPGTDVGTQVIAINEAPQALVDHYDSGEGGTLSASAPGVLGNDLDEDDDPLIAQLVVGPSSAETFALAADGSFTYVPQSHFSGSDSFTYRAADPYEPGVPATVAIDVTAVADAPTLAVKPASGSMDATISLEITASLVDADGSEILLVTVTGVPAGAALSAGTPQGEGVWQLTPAQLAGLTLSPSFGSDDDFSLTVVATATEGANGDFASTVDTLPVTVLAAGQLFTVAPCRLLDTRLQGPPLAHDAPRLLTVSGSCGVPATARAIAVNLTVAGASGGGHVTAYPADQSPPATSNLNFAASQVRANNAILVLSAAGEVSFRAMVSPDGTVELIVDVIGYFE